MDHRFSESGEVGSLRCAEQNESVDDGEQIGIPAAMRKSFNVESRQSAATVMSGGRYGDQGS